MKSRKSLLKTGLLSILGVWILAGVAIGGALWYGKSTVSQTLDVAMSAPPFALPDQDGRTHNLSDYAGRAIAVAFVPNGDSETVQQLRSINKAIRQFDTIGVKVFGVAPIDAPTAKRIHDTERLEFPLLLDRGQAVARQYGASAKVNPNKRLSYVIGPDGRVLLPIEAVNSLDHGSQLVELAECCVDAKPLPGSPFLSKPIANFTLPRVTDGHPESLYGDRKQKATVLLIMSAECPCSRKYDARCKELAETYGAKGVRFVAMNSSKGETPPEIADHARKAGLPYPILKDAGNVLADKLDAHVTPEAFVMDAKGVLRYHGRIDDNRDPALATSHDLRNALDFLIAGKNPTIPEAQVFGCAIAREPKKTVEKE